MKTRALLLALPVLALVSGCRDNRASVSVEGICAPADTCAFTIVCDAFYIGYPTLDVAASANDTYSVYIQVRNQTANNADDDLGRTNTNDAFVDETFVEFSGGVLPDAILGTNQRVPANSTTVFRVEVIPDAMNAGPTLAAYAPTADPRELTAKLRLRGYWADGSRFETGEFPITIRICSGCVTATTGLCAAGAPTCPPNSNGQLPVACM